MDDRIEVIADDDGVAVFGRKEDINDYLKEQDLDPRKGREISSERIRRIMHIIPDLMKEVSKIEEQSCMYLKLTPESAKRLKDSGGLMKTKVKGVSNIMLGKPGTKSLKWLQAETKRTSFLTNPAVISGAAGVMSQLFVESETQQLRETMERLDGKLDDVLRGQRNETLGKMKGAASILERAMTLWRSGGDPQTIWDTSNGSMQSILDVEQETLGGLDDLAEKIGLSVKPRELKNAETEIGLKLAILARCLELEDDYDVLEMEHVLAAAPQNADGHRLGLEKARRDRLQEVLSHIKPLVKKLDAAGGNAIGNTILHAKAARAIVDSRNQTVDTINIFSGSFDDMEHYERMSTIPWRAALQDPIQRGKAAHEALETCKKGAVGALVVGGMLAVGGLAQDKSDKNE